MKAPAQLLADDAERLRYNLISVEEIGRIFASEADFQKAAETALRGILGAVAITSGALFTYSAHTKTLVCAVGRGLKKVPVDIPINGILKRLLINKHAPLILKDPLKWPKSLQQVTDFIRPLTPHVWVPLIMQNELLGLLSLGDKFLKEDYRPEDLHLLDTIGHHFAVGLYNQRLMADSREANFQLNRKVVELETLYDAGLALSSSLKVDNVVEEVMLSAVGVLDARAGCLFIHNDKGQLILIHQVGLDEEQLVLLRSPIIRRRLNRVLKTQKPIVLKPGTLSEAFGITHGLIAPVGQTGILAVFDKENRKGILPFTEADTRLLELMAQQAGSALANARLYDNILEVKNYNQNILSSIGNGVISTDLNGRIVQINASIERVFGTGAVPLGQSCAVFFQRTGCHNLAKAIRSSLIDGKSQQIDGEYAPEHDVTLNARIAALRNEQEEIQGVVIALEDLTAEMRIRDRFKQYASDQVVDLLLNQTAPPTLGGEERDVTMLFADIRGSSALLGRIGAEKMVAVLNRCFSRLNEIIFEYNGTLDKYTGDGFLVVYGAPVALPDNSERAVRTALAMQEEMAKLNRETSDQLGLGLGIARGKVIAGNIGSLRRMEYTVIGESVNVASRLCDGARAGQIWSGHNIYAELNKTFDFQYLGRKRFKNVDPIEVYEVAGIKGARRTKQLGGAMPDKKKIHKIIDLTIPMLPEMELAATKTAEGVAQFMGLSEDKLEEIKMALIEACINAFEHSQSKDEQISINFAIGDEDLTIQISDTGQGFDPNAARKEVVERRERGESKRGWGLTIMSELMDHVNIQSDENGTLITMVKRR